MADFYSQSRISFFTEGIVQVLLISLIFHECRSDFEICTPTPGKNTTVYRFTKQKCPGGVLFDIPIIVGCLQSTDNTNNFFKDLCEQEEFIEDIQNSGEKKINFIFDLDGDQLDEQVTCIGEEFDRCSVDLDNPESVIEADVSTFTSPKWYGCSEDEDDDDDSEVPSSPEEEARRKDGPVFNQTERMFKFMLGLAKDVDENGPPLRIVELLKQCFKVLEKFCDTQYVSQDFGKDILKAFLFLLRDSDLSNFKDISVDDYEILKKTLIGCDNLEKPFTLFGRTCKTCASVHSIEKNGQSVRYISDEFAFAKGKYDIPVDAAWGVVSFVHGLCFGTYKPNVNYHHYFQREMERLFTKEIMHRWSRPPKLQHEDLWDHMFSAPVRSAMRNLDMCVHAAYLKTPFLHRIERPLKESASSNGTAELPKSRRRRSLPTMNFGEDKSDLLNAGWCFQTPEDRIQTTEAYVNFHCPNNRNALDEIKRLANETLAAWTQTDEPLDAGPEQEGERFDGYDSPETELF